MLFRLNDRGSYQRDRTLPGEGSVGGTLGPAHIVVEKNVRDFGSLTRRTPIVVGVKSVYLEGDGSRRSLNVLRHRCYIVRLRRSAEQGLLAQGVHLLINIS